MLLFKRRIPLRKSIEELIELIIFSTLMWLVCEIQPYRMRIIVIGVWDGNVECFHVLAQS